MKGIGDRYIEILKVESKNSKLTINPNTGRVTLKVPNDISDDVKIETIALANVVKNCTEFTSVTYRGKISRYKDGLCYVRLTNEAKTHSVVLAANN